MAENRGTMGGFAAVNKPEGIIENCYCSTQLSGSQFVAGGFIGKNDGGIAKSYCEEKTKKLSGNFAGFFFDANFPRKERRLNRKCTCSSRIILIGG